MSLLASSEKSRCGSAALQSGAQQQQMINCSFSICKIDKFMAAADTQAAQAAEAALRKLLPSR